MVDQCRHFTNTSHSELLLLRHVHDPQRSGRGQFEAVADGQIPKQLVHLYGGRFDWDVYDYDAHLQCFGNVSIYLAFKRVRYKCGLP